MTIPVGKDGFVPEKEILNHYRHHYNEKQKQYEERRAAAIREGRRPAPDISLAKRDYSTTADRVIPLKCTPEQIAEWWADPSRCDVQDVDCAGPPKVNIPEGMTAAQKRDQGRIRVIATPLEERMIRRELVMGFEPGDVSRIAASGPVIQASPMARAVTGSYDPANNRVTVDRDRGLEQGTIVHELSHQLRATDRSRRGPVVTANPDADIEESCTVAEQMARSDKVDYSGYYQKACVFDERTRRWRDPTPSEARRMAEEDHMLFTEGRGKGLKGDAAIRSVERHWGESHIARLRMHGNKMAVNRMADETGMVERVSMARPRTKEEAERMAAVDVTNATAGRPGVAMANASPRRGPLSSRVGMKIVKGPSRGRNGRTADGRYLVLIDESGTPSYSSGSKEFTITASINSDPDALVKIVDSEPKGTRFPKDSRYTHELKFSTSSDKVRRETLEKIAATNPSVYAVHISRTEMKDSRPRSIYHRAASELMDDVMRDEKLKDGRARSDIVIDRSGYLSQPAARIMADRAAFDARIPRPMRVETVSSFDDKRLQAHDFVAGAVGDKYNGNGTFFGTIAGVSHIRTVHAKR